MRTLSRKYLLLIILLFFSFFITAQIDGLWLVEKVTVGSEEMTPIARWMRFNKDSTQQSGNGWLQHSVGTWHYNKMTNKLKIINTNGYIDHAGPFTVDLKNDKMYWKRLEEGQEVIVQLKRIDDLPASPANNLLGVWDLNKVTENGNDVTDKFDPKGKRYLFLRWDQTFITQNSPKGRIMGVYKVHAHKPEIEMIPYGENCERTFWTFSIAKNILITKLLNSDKEIKMEYKKINYFPQ